MIRISEFMEKSSSGLDSTSLLMETERTSNRQNDTMADDRTEFERKRNKNRLDECGADVKILLEKIYILLYRNVGKLLFYNNNIHIAM